MFPCKKLAYAQSLPPQDCAWASFSHGNMYWSRRYIPTGGSFALILWLHWCDKRCQFSGRWCVILARCQLVSAWCGYPLYFLLIPTVYLQVVLTFFETKLCQRCDKFIANLSNSRYRCFGKVVEGRRLAADLSPPSIHVPIWKARLCIIFTPLKIVHEWDFYIKAPVPGLW